MRAAVGSQTSGCDKLVGRDRQAIVASSEKGLGQPFYMTNKRLLIE